MDMLLFQRMKSSFLCLFRFILLISDIWTAAMMNGNNDLLRDDQQSDNQMMPTSHTKKKCRGNRKEQHARRRLRKRELNEATTAPRADVTIETQLTMMDTETPDEHFDSIIVPIEDVTQVSSLCKRGITDKSNSLSIKVSSVPCSNNNGSMATKRKREASNKTEMPMNKSFSQMTISQGRPKKNKASRTAKSGKKKQSDRLADSSRSTLLPRYLTLSDKAFKQMLVRAGLDGYHIVQWLDTDEKLRCIRQLTNTVNTLNYVKLQQQLWQEYYEVETTTEFRPSRITKANAKEHNACPSFGRPLKIIQQRRKTIEHQLKRTENELNQQLLQLPEWTDTAEPSISSDALSTTIFACVEKGQHRLCAAFKHKQAMLKLDVDDHRLINAFYLLQPNDEQVSPSAIFARFSPFVCILDSFG